jgi:hypothetical protein
MDFQAFIVRGYLSFNLGFLPFGAGSPPQPPAALQQQGIEGTARSISGNQMRSPRYPPSDRVRPSDSGAFRLPPGSSSDRRSPSDSGGGPISARPISGRPTATSICVFRLTNQTQVTGAGKNGLYRSVQTLLVRQTETDDSGRFRILLPPGTYSVFTKKGSLFYATRRDEKNNIAPVEVLPGKMTRVDCSVVSDHAAVY